MPALEVPPVTHEVCAHQYRGQGLAEALRMAKVLRRRAPGSVLVRLGLGIVGGGIIGALGMSGRSVSPVVTWLLLIGVPAVLSWSWLSREAAVGKRG